MSTLEAAYQRLQHAVDGLADVIDARMAHEPDGTGSMTGAAEDIAELREECSRLTSALQSAASRNAELDRIVDEIHRRLGSTIADVDDLLRD